MKLVTDSVIPEAYKAEFLAAKPDLEIVTQSPREREAFLEALGDAEVVMGSFGGGSGDLFRQVVLAARQARWIHTSSAGVDEILCPEFYERDVMLTCAKGESVATLLAEHAMALLLSLTRCIVEAARKDRWERGGFRGSPTEVRYMTLGIVGFGAVGRALAERAAAFGMRILGVRSRPAEAPPGVEAVWGPEGLPELLSRSDVVALILPNTPRTVGSFGADELRQMKRTALLINVGRGQVVDGQALEQALVEGWIAGAGLDVMPEEPWPAESPLWRMDNVIITSHIAGNSPHRAKRNLRAFVDNFIRYVRGEPLASLVDRQERY
ncbi:MAG: D-2-hydroxyacid dehydrogenase [Chloroflexi bacterium]|nr:D-2-hydroxyacid dehydrogenase [Chloroflexota bacterium]